MFGQKIQDDLDACRERAYFPNINGVKHLCVSRVAVRQDRRKSSGSDVVAHCKVSQHGEASTCDSESSNAFSIADLDTSGDGHHDGVIIFAERPARL